MALIDTNKAVRDLIRLNWTATPIDWSNFGAEKLAPPEPDPANPLNCAWIRPKVGSREARRAELGPVAMRRYVGGVVVQIFTPAKSGDAPIYELAEQLSDLFRDATGSGVQFMEPNPVYIGDDGSGEWQQLNLEIPFRRDEVK